MIKFEPFDKDVWAGFSGAMPWATGEQPMVGEVEIGWQGGRDWAMIIVDALHIEIVLNDKEMRQHVWKLPLATTFVVAVVVVHNLPKNLDAGILKVMGFEYAILD